MTAQCAVPETLHVWAICLQAGEEARRRGDRRVGTDHLVLALLLNPSTETVLGVELPRAREAQEVLDREALIAVGLGDEVQAPPLSMRCVPAKPRFRDVAGKDRVPMAPAAKEVLEAAARPNRRKGYVTDQQVLAQLLDLRAPDPAAMLLDFLGVDGPIVRSHLSVTAPDA